MSYDPSKPEDGSVIVAAELRGQFSGLHDEISAVPAVTGAVVDGVTTLAAGNLATVTVSLTTGVLHFTFALPEGVAGPPGEVTQAQLSNDLVNTQNAAVLTVLPLTSANTNNIQPLSITSGDFVVQALIEKVNEMLLGLRR